MRRPVTQGAGAAVCSDRRALAAAGLVATVFVASVVLVGCGNTPSPATAAGTATIQRVVDGDTVDVDINGRRERVRLIGIDTPETKKPNTPIECYGPEASAFAISLLPKGTIVTLTRDVEARDDFGRLLAYVTRSSDGLFVNLALAEQGYANVLTIPPNVAHADEFVGAVRTARNEHRGLWGGCSGFGVPEKK
jgi:micrococcal nuclease